MKVEVNVPNGIVKFLKLQKVDVQKYAEESVKHAFRADFDVFRNDLEINIDVDKLVKKYNLENFVWTYKEDP